MASTLNNFGVPHQQSDGGGSAQRGGIQMPKPKHKFRLLTYGFGGEGNTINFTKNVMTAGRPSVSTQSVPVHSYNSIAYYGGKPEWQTIEVTLRDDICNNVHRLVGAQEQRQMNHRAQTMPSSAAFYKFEMRMQALDGGDSRILENWFIEGCFLEQINYDSWDYSSSDPMTISLTIRYDNAYLEDEYDAGVEHTTTCENMTDMMSSTTLGGGGARNS